MPSSSSATAAADAPPACGRGIPPAFLAKLGSALAGKRCLVTGGAGFLGGHIVQVLLQAQAKVRVFDVVPPRVNHALWTEQDQVEVQVGNLLNEGDVSKALTDIWCVIHVASPSPTCRDAALFQSVNVGGTGVLLKACRNKGVERFVYTSSASVVFDGRDQANYDETAPPPMAAMDDYTKSKLAAEQLVLRSNEEEGPTKLWTCAIRPHGIFGARDPHFLPVLAQTGAKGKSKFLIGDGSNLVDFTYVENVAYAHALAAVQLGPKAKINGKAYFITNREPIFFWEFITRMHRAWGWTLPRIPMPVAVMRPMAVVLEAIGSVAGFRPTFTTQAINYSGCAHYYSSARAVEEMGYQPPVCLDEAINRSLAHFWDLRNKNKPAPLAAPARPGQAILPPRTVSQHPLFIPSVLVALVAILVSLSAGKLLFALLALTAWYGYSSFRSSLGAAPRMFVENARDKLVSRKNRNILVTGANRGLGFHTCLDLLERGYASRESGSVLFVGCRDAARGAEAIAAMEKKYPGANVRPLAIDLGSFASIKAAADTLKKSNVQIHVLIHNAGAMISSSVTADGHESQWAANYLGHFFFTQLLLKDKILAPAARIVNVSSIMHRMVDFFDSSALSGLLTPAAKGHGASRLGLYCRSKLAQIAWAGKQQRIFNKEADTARQESFGKQDPPNPEMDRRSIVSVNPGAVATDFIEHFIPGWMARPLHPLLIALFEKTPAQGVQGITHAALASELDNVGGIYLDNCRVILPSAIARDQNVQEELWNKSMQACEKHL